MRRDLERRFQAVEASERGGIEIWVYNRDGMIRGPDGEQMAREEVQSRCRAVGKLAFFCSEDDARL